MTDSLQNINQNQYDSQDENHLKSMTFPLRVGTVFDFNNHNSAKKITLKSIETQYLQGENVQSKSATGTETGKEIEHKEGGICDETDSIDNDHLIDNQNVQTLQRDKIRNFLSWVTPEKSQIVPMKKKKGESVSISLVRSALCNVEDNENSPNPYLSPHDQSPLALFKVFIHRVTFVVLLMIS